MPPSILACAACMRRASQIVSRGKQWPQHDALLALRQLAPVARASLQTRATAAKNDDEQPSPPTVAQKSERDRLRTIVKKHLVRLDDPWNIEQYVQKALARDRFEEALLLTQTAGRDKQLVVAWNHLIEYQLKNQRLRPAIKLFNDVSDPRTLFVPLHRTDCRR